ncbi:MAG: hypothetical protein EPN91_02245 [Salinibacterium sp.]|nr:MAG: hypothetical protein EPN91_02245 [Salinibacterium sp.]
MIDLLEAVRTNRLPEATLNLASLTRDQVIARASERAVTCFAILHDGQWVERGKMGWWGAVSSPADPDAWQAQVNAAIQALPADSWLTVVDCHI